MAISSAHRACVGREDGSSRRAEEAEEDIGVEDSRRRQVLRHRKARGLISCDGLTLRRLPALLLFIDFFDAVAGLPGPRVLLGAGERRKPGGAMTVPQAVSHVPTTSILGALSALGLAGRGGDVLRERGGMEGDMVDGGETAITLTDPEYTKVKDFMALERIGSWSERNEEEEPAMASGGRRHKKKGAKVMGFTRVHLGSKYAWFYPDPPWGRKDIHRAGSAFLQYWHMLVWFTMVYIAIVLPFRAAGFRYGLGDDCGHLGLSWKDIVADCIFLCDMVFSSKTAFYKQSGGGHLILIDDVESIKRNYVSSVGFLCDVLGILPLREIYCLTERTAAMLSPQRVGPFRPAIVHRKFIGLFKILRMVKLFRLHHFRHMWRFVNAKFPDKTRVLNLVKLLAMLLFAGHLLACTWYFVGNLSPDSWILRSGELMKSDHWFSHYVTSFYFVYATMTTVGYGDIKGVTVPERVFCVMAMVVGGFLFGILIGSVPHIMERRSQGGNRYSELEVHLKEYLSEKKTPPGLKSRIMQYMEYRYPDRRMFPDKKIRDGLPRVLRRDLAVALNQDLVNMCYVLSRAESTALRDVCDQLVQEFAENGLVILREGQPLKGIYFVRAGQVELTRCGGFVKRLLPGDIFGENALMGQFQGDVNLYTATAVAPTELCFLPLEKFEMIVVNHPNMVFTTDPSQWTKARACILERHEKRSTTHILDDALEMITGLKDALSDAIEVQKRQAEILEAWSQHGMRSDTLEQHIAPPGELASASRADTSGLTAATVRFSPAASASPPPGTASEEAQAKQAAMGPTTRDE